MGVRVASQGPGKNVMTCAHRYQQWSPSPSLYVPHLLTGQCYLLGDDLRVGQEERRWRRVVCDSEHLTRRKKDHEWFAYCQQGHGASFAKDNQSPIFGAPGAYQWKDVAVGAPYDGSGRVYLYYGSTNGIKKNPAQVFSPGSKRVSLFGYSLSVNLDIDDNRYPDLAVGSLSDSVFVFRARPVVSISSSLKIILVNQGCGSDNICQSNLEVRYRFCSRKTEKDQDVFTSLGREDGVAVITPSEEDAALEITVSNRGGDDAHQSHSVISLPETLHYSSAVDCTPSDAQVSCTANDKGTLIDCDVGNPLPKDAEVTFYVFFTTSSISLSTTDVNVTLQLETLVKPSQVSLGESWKEKSAINSVEEIGASVQYEFRVKLTVFMERKAEYLTKVTWWIIFLTVVALLLMLAALVVLLWKRGCIQSLAQKAKPSHDTDPNAETAHLDG